jgi:Tfp pilus assembly protein PilX
MTRVRSWRRRRFWPRRYDDRGTSLVLALVFVTVGSLAVMAVLGFADASARGTRLLRDRADEVAAAEAAANIAINNLRKSPYAGSGDCLGTGNKLTLPTFYTRAGGSQDSARVTCALDTNLSGQPSLPAQSLLTYSSSSSALGNTVSGTGSLRVTGPVHSNSNINLAGANLTASAITARAACVNVFGSFNPTPTCNIGGAPVNPPAYTPDVSNLPPRPVPTCTGTGVYDLLPGVYTDSTRLSLLTSSSCHSGKAIVHLLPGRFYFNFNLVTLLPPSIGVWSVTAGTVVAGNTAAGVTLTPGVVPTLPGACKSPLSTGTGWQAPSPADGVLLVFGGNSQLNVTGNGRAEICGQYAPKAPAGLAAVAIAAQPTGGNLGLLCGTTSFPCAAVSTGLVLGAAPAAFYVQGTTMLPDRELVVSLDNATNQKFAGGVIAHRFGASTSRSVAADPVIVLAPPYPRQTVVLLTVFVCPGATSCDSGGDAVLRAKVAVTDPTGTTTAGQRLVSVLSWTTQPVRP